MSEQYVAVKALTSPGTRLVEINEDAPYEVLPDTTAPWLSREEQEMVLQALKHAQATSPLPPSHFTDAITLLQSRLYPTTGDRG